MNQGAPITLQIKGLNHIPAIKNSMFAIVDKKNREWKRRCVQSFESQLLSSFLMRESEIQTPHFLPSLIALLPQDDRWQDIPSIQIECITVPKGEEGAEIEITPI